MISISLCMIVKDEEETLKICLDSIKDIVDEIIIVDTGSTDKTKIIAQQYTNKIYDFEWVNDFSKARNFSFSKATKEYIMWLDADDIILDRDKYLLLNLKHTLENDTDVVIMRYDLPNKNKNTIKSSFYRERIIKSNKNFVWCDPVHEYINFSGKIIKMDIAVTHNKQKLPTRRNLNIFEEYINNGNELSERNWFYYARELFNFGQYNKAAKYYKKFLSTQNGLHSNYLDSCIELSDCYRILNNNSEELKILLSYFEKFAPRAEICCKIGYYYKNYKNYKKAIEWFEIAPYTPKPNDLGSYTPECWDYIPYMELCACYYKLNDIDNAIINNQKAALVKPNDPIVCHNRKYLSEVKNQILKIV